MEHKTFAPFTPFLLQEAAEEMLENDFKIVVDGCVRCFKIDPKHVRTYSADKGYSKSP